MDKPNLEDLKINLKAHLEEEFPELPEGNFDEMTLKELVEDAITNSVEVEESLFLSAAEQAFLNGATTAFHAGDQALEDYLNQ